MMESGRNNSEMQDTVRMTTISQYPAIVRYDDVADPTGNDLKRSPRFYDKNVSNDYVP